MEQDAEYELAPEPKKPAAAPSATSVRTLGYQTPKTLAPADQRPQVDVEILKTQTLPLWLLVGGIVVESVASYLENRHDLRAAGIQIAVEVGGGTILMLVAVLLTAKFRGIEIGSFWSAALRVAAISVAPAAVGDILMPLAWIIPFGGLLLLGVQFVLYFALIGALFDMEESDTWYCVSLIFLIDVGIYFLLRFGV
jgi:hypothetical protein